MLKILFFARVREQLGCSALEINWPDAGYNLETLQEKLIREHGEAWREVLSQENMIRAVNHAVVAANCTLHDGDEIAFYPPVTGG
jgi:molybdopterin synthase sulfur carrier subunit